MWHFYILAGVLAAGVVVKLMLTLAGKGRHRHGGPVMTADRQLGITLAVLIPLGALSFYLPLGRPDLPGAPAIFDNPGEMWMRQQALLRKRPLQILLETNPEHIGALVHLAQISARQGSYEESVKFYQRAVAVAQRENDTLLRVYAVSLGEMQVKAASGKVDDGAVGTFEFVRALYPASPIARYYLALAKAQRGDQAAAIAEWESLLSEGSPRAYWKEQVRHEMAKSRQELKKKK